LFNRMIESSHQPASDFCKKPGVHLATNSLTAQDVI
jgi:hypothetical protein